MPILVNFCFPRPNAGNEVVAIPAPASASPEMNARLSIFFMVYSGKD
jgi:hypothetical protein